MLSALGVMLVVGACGQTADPRVIIEATEDDADQLRAVIAKPDRPRRQVFFELLLYRIGPRGGPISGNPIRHFAPVIDQSAPLAHIAMKGDGGGDHAIPFLGFSLAALRDEYDIELLATPQLLTLEHETVVVPLAPPLCDRGGLWGIWGCRPGDEPEWYAMLDGKVVDLTAAIRDDGTLRVLLELTQQDAGAPLRRRQRLTWEAAPGSPLVLFAGGLRRDDGGLLLVLTAEPIEQKADLQHLFRVRIQRHRLRLERARQGLLAEQGELDYSQRRGIGYDIHRHLTQLRARSRR